MPQLQMMKYWKKGESLSTTIKIGTDIWKKFGLRSSSFVTVFLFIGFFIVIFTHTSYSSFRNTSQIVLLRLTAYVLVVCLVSVDKDIGIFLMEILQGNWVLATNSNFLIPLSLQPDVVDLWFLNLYILWDQII